MNLSSLLDRSVDEFGPYDCIASATTCMSNVELRTASARLASSLSALGVAPGALVATVLPNCPEVLVAYFAIWRAGAVAVPFFWQITAPELMSRFAHATPSAVITDAEHLAVVQRALGAASTIPVIVVGAASAGERTVAYAPLIADAVEPGAVVARQATDIALVLYTSGTTGAPKGVMLSHGNLLSRPHVLTAGGRRRQMTSLVAMPMAHIAGLSLSLDYLTLGDRIHILESFQPLAVLEAIERHRVEVVNLSPSQLMTLLALEDASRFDVSSMRMWTYSAAPMPVAKAEAFERRFGGRLNALYGMTEAAGLVTTTEILPAGSARKRASTGRAPARGARVRVVAEGADCAPGVEGEIWIAGPMVFTGYFRMPDESRAAFDGEWFRTGDLGTFDADGDLTLSGRIKELIIRSGLNIYPLELEEVARRLPWVMDCAVVAVPNEITGEQPVAFVVADGAFDPDEQALLAHFARNLAAYKCPAAVFFVASLPRTLTGKVDKPELRRRAEAHAATHARFAASIAGRPLDEQWTRVRALVASVAAEVSGNSEAALRTEQALAAQGFDSLRAVAYSAALASRLGCAVPATLLFERPTLAKVATYVGSSLLGLGAESAASIEAQSTGAVRAPTPGAHDHFAIVGMACRFPGGIDSLAKLWSALERGTDLVKPFPDDGRFTPPLGYEAMPAGHFLERVKCFDAAFFGMTPLEARDCDPQHRMLLEMTWEALEDAGIPPHSLRGSNTGVFVGISQSEYLSNVAPVDRRSRYGGGIGHMRSVASGRISYFLDLRGPNFALDTACSSSLVALHLACQHLRSGEIDLAIVGGTNLLFGDGIYKDLISSSALAHDGRCKTFDASADGFGRGEGGGVVVLRRLRDAELRGENVHALIAGTAINHDGHSATLTAPNADAQTALIRTVMTATGIDAAELGYVETHGTGTSLGDPIELAAIARALGDAPRPRASIQLGAAKAVLGHLESAAGMASVLKAALALERRELTPNAQLERLNPHLDLGALGGFVSTTRAPLPAPPSGRRHASVSGFGFSGTNAFGVLAEYRATSAASAEPSDGARLLCLSARSATGLRRVAARYARLLKERPSIDVASLCAAAVRTRSHHQHRLALLATSRAELLEKLVAYATDGDAAGGLVGVAQDAPVRVALLFTGQGAQCVGMGHALYRHDSAFRADIDACAQLAAPYLGRSLLDILFGTDAELINRTQFTQPALFALEYAVARRWLAWGVRPSALIGHSIGEIVAACVAGAMNLEDAIAMVCRRGGLMHERVGGGAMASIQADEATVAALIAGHTQVLSIAAFNGLSTVVSGDRAALEEVLLACDLAQLQWRRLVVSHAFHSPLMDPMLEPFRAVCAELTLGPIAMPLVSNVSATLLPRGSVLDADYWTRHVREPVRFTQGIRQLFDHGVDVLLEVGPQPVLLGLAAQLEPTAKLVASLRRGRDDRTELLTAVGTLYICGVELDWDGFYRDVPTRAVRLPTYPFDPQEHWLKEPTPTLGAHAPAPRSMAGTRRDSALPTAQFDVALEGEIAALIRGHRLHGRPLMPAAGMLEQVVQAGRELLGVETVRLTNVAFERPLVIGEDGEPVVDAQVLIDPRTEGAWAWSVHTKSRSVPDAGVEAAPAWNRHTTGLIESGGPAAPREPLESLQRSFGKELPVTAMYDDLAQHDLDYGIAFRTVEQMWIDAARPHECLSRLRLRNEVDSTLSYAVHPVLLDGCFQASSTALGGGAGVGRTYLPAGIESLLVHADLPDAIWCHAVTTVLDPNQRFRVDFRIYDSSGRCLVEIDNMRFHAIDALPATNEAGSGDDIVHQIRWQQSKSPDGAAKRTDTDAVWLVLADESGVGERVAHELERLGNGTCCALVGGSYRAPSALEPDQWLCPIGDEAALGRLLAAVRERFPAGVQGIVHCWAIETERASDEDEPAAALRRAVGSALHLAQAVAARATDGLVPRLAFVTRAAECVSDETQIAPAGAAVHGFARSLAAEYPELRISQFDLSARPDALDSEVRSLVTTLLSDRDENRMVFRGDQCWVPRLHRVPVEVDALAWPAGSCRLVQTTIGDLRGLQFEAIDRSPPAGSDIEVALLSCGLNFREVMTALGVYPGAQATTFAGDGVGVVVAVGDGAHRFAVGQQVIVPFAPMQTHFVIDETGAFPLPSYLDVADATTVPNVYVTAYHGLHNLARLQTGERVLIHAGTGGVGMAAIQLARAAGAQVFATAGTPRKRQLLRELGVDHVFDSRSTSFRDDIATLLGDRKLDVVLNSLAGELLTAGFDLLGPGGRFIDIGKATKVESAQIPDGVRYLQFDLLTEAAQSPALIGETLAKLNELLEARRITPLPRRIYRASDAVTAFRHMSQGKHTGKIVLDFQRPVPGRSSSNLTISPVGSYVVTGGLGGVGLEVVRWLLERGAGGIALLGRRPPAPEIRHELETLGGSRVMFVTVDVGARDPLASALAEIRGRLPIRGVFHAAGVLADGMIPAQSWDAFERVAAAKVNGTWNLDQLTRHDPLDHFVLFSSVTAVLGNAGQTPYGAANAFMDAVADQRRLRGLPAMSIAWGMWTVGMGSDQSAATERRLAARGIKPLAPTEALAALDRLLAAGTDRPVVMRVDWPRYAAGADRPVPLLAELVSRRPAAAPATIRVARPTAGRRNRRIELDGLSPEARTDAMHSFLTITVRNLLGLAAEQPIDARMRLSALGLDSLAAAEFQRALSAELDCKLAPFVVMDYPTIGELSQHILERM